MTLTTLAGSATARLHALITSPAADALMKEQAAIDFKARQADVAEWKRLDAVANAEAKAYAPIKAKLAAKFEAAVAALEQARAAYGDTELAHSQKMNTIQRQRDQIKCRLSATAPEAIAAFAARLDGEMHAADNERDSVQPCFELKGGWNNNASVRARISAIAASRALLHELALEALTDVELEAKLEAIRASWPEVERRPALVA